MCTCSVVSDSVTLRAARLLCSQNSPGKNTGVNSLFLLQGNLPHPGMEPRSTSLQVDSLSAEPPGSKSRRWRGVSRSWGEEAGYHTCPVHTTRLEGREPEGEPVTCSHSHCCSKCPNKALSKFLVCPLISFH